MIELGTTLRCNLPPRHLWVVLSDPTKTDGIVLLVNMTTMTDECVDAVCVLGPADYELLTQETTIAYSRRLEGRAAKLDALVQRGDFTIVTPVPSATLKKILAGAAQSRELSNNQKKLLGHLG